MSLTLVPLLLKKSADEISMVSRGWKLDITSSIFSPTQRAQHAGPPTREESFKDKVKDGGEWPTNVPRPAAGAPSDENSEISDDGLADLELHERRLKELDHAIQRSEALVANDPSNLKLRRGITYQRTLRDKCIMELDSLKKKLGR